MKFSIRTTGYMYDDEGKEMLEPLGFTFLKEGRGCSPHKIQGDPTIEIDTLEELVDLSKKYGDLIINVDSIEIYDDYRE